MTTTRLIADRFSFNTKDALGQGGMGTVYRGKDTQTGSFVAIKNLRKDIISQNPEVVKRFRREGEALSQLNHPNIVKMLDYSEDENDHYLVMEYVAGGSLYDLLEEQPQLSVQRALYIGLDVADALTRAHRLAILHRDIKPANVLIAEDGTPRLTDFGMALVGKSHVTQSGAIVGTLAYLSPEALNGEELDERTDIWAYGVMLYEMLAGRRPFEHDRAGSLISMILTQPVPDLELIRPDLPTSVVDLVYRMLIKDRNARIPSIRLVGAELEAIIRGTGTTVQPVVVADASGRFDTTTQAQAVTDEFVVQHNLPTQPTAFIGRDQEIKDLRHQLFDPQNRILTLLGPGGVGKTRLAIELGRHVLDHFIDGVFLVPLAAVENDSLILHAIAESTRFSFGQDADPKTQLLSYLQEKHMLLILDNFEHLVNGANIVAEIISQSLGLKVIVTSRERLRLRGEHIYELQGMALPDLDKSASLDTDTLMQFPVVQLFAQNARRILPDFEVNSETGAYVTKISHMVQGLPLGIELATGWLEALNLDEISREIEESLDFLETDLRDVPERHRSMRAVFDYSWNLLSEDERTVFMNLAAFRGGFEREAAQRVAGASLRALTGLVNKSLLQRDTLGRYSISKLLRQYAEEKLNAEGNPTEINRQHAVYYAEFLHKLEPLFSTRHENKALEAIDREIQNTRMAWNWAIANRMWGELDNLLNTISLFYQNRSILKQGGDSFAELAEALKADGYGENSSYYWRARTRQALLEGRTGDFTTTFAYMPPAAAFFEAAGNKVEYAYALNLIGYAHMMQGNIAEARDYILRSLELAQDYKFTDVWFFAKGNLGYVEYLAGNYEEARIIYETLLEDNLTRDYSPVGYAFSLNNLGEITRDLGDMEGAKKLFSEAYELFKSFRSRRGMAFSLNNLAGIHFICGDYEVAEVMYEKAYEINKDIGDRYGIGHSLSALGNAALFAGEIEKAKTCYEQSLQIRREIGSRKGIADSLSDLAQAAVILGRYDEAQALFDEVLLIQQQIGDKAGESDSYSGLGLVALMRGDHETAKSLFDEGLSITAALDNPQVKVQALAGLGEYYLHKKDYEQARWHFLEVVRLNQMARFPTLNLYALASMSLVHLEAGDYAQAFKLASNVICSQQVYNAIPITYPRAQSVYDAARQHLSAESAAFLEQEAKRENIADAAKALLSTRT